MRRITLAALILHATSTLTAQSPAPPRFEVASVKPDPKQDRGGARSLTEFSLPIVRVLPSGQVESYGHTLRNLIAWAYEINIDAPPLLDVFRSELGLKLVKERATINDLVVERVEPLIEN